MRKCMAAWLLVLLIVAETLCAYGLAEEKTESGLFAFPAGLLEIEAEAFAGTKVRTAVFGDSLLSIGRGAFRSARSLTDVYIPKSTQYIANSAFIGCGGFTVHGVKDSYAQDWAQKRRVPFVEDDIWVRGASQETDHVLYWDPKDQSGKTVNPDKRLIRTGRPEGEEESQRPQDRAELFPIEERFP